MSFAFRTSRYLPKYSRKKKLYGGGILGLIVVVGAWGELRRLPSMKEVQDPMKIYLDVLRIRTVKNDRSHEAATISRGLYGHIILRPATAEGSEPPDYLSGHDALDCPAFTHFTLAPDDLELVLTGSSDLKEFCSDSEYEQVVNGEVVPYLVALNTAKSEIYSYTPEGFVKALEKSELCSSEKVSALRKLLDVRGDAEVSLSGVPHSLSAEQREALLADPELVELTTLIPDPILSSETLEPETFGQRGKVFLVPNSNVCQSDSIGCAFIPLKF